MTLPSAPLFMKHNGEFFRVGVAFFDSDEGGVLACKEGTGDAFRIGELPKDVLDSLAARKEAIRK